MKTGLDPITILSRNLRSPAAALIVSGTLLCAGCGQKSGDAPAKSDAPAATADGHDHSHEGHSHDAEADIAAAMAKLSPEDRALAETQKVCIVAREPLGSMGTPVKVEHDGQAYFLCCIGCKEAFAARPDKFIAELKDSGEAAAVPAPEGASDPAAESKGEGT